MNIGENIQNFRKKLSLSQEELAQKIPVSRQTVSQWENGQTVPSIDNLIILKEIFGVSVDEILGVGNAETEKEEEAENVTLPRERYTVRHTKQELKEYYRANVKSYFLMPAVFEGILLVLLFLLMSVTEYLYDTFAGIIIGACLMGILIPLRRFILYRKSWQCSFMKIYESTYEYTFFDDCFIAEVYRQGEKIFSRKALYSDIERTEQVGKWISFQLGNQVFLIKKEELKDNSVLLTDIYNKKAGMRGKPFSRKRSMIKKFAVIILLLILTAIPGFIDRYNNSSEAVENFEFFTGIRLPEPSAEETKNLTDEALGLRGYVLYEDNLTFDETEANELEKNLDSDTRWIKGLPDELLGITAGLTEVYMRDIDFDYVLIFNSTDGSFNKLPDKNGIYYCINALYDCETNHLKILEYHMDYVK
ncbi:MAG: helix-turn-helix transcriptional regulator [Clostridia bacterium]|nr:helix-turn-helix transcriptional regulator [Clostridia bacterium]